MANAAIQALLASFSAVLTSLSPPSAVNTTFTFATGAAQANLYDGNDTTNAADPAGITSSTQAAYDFGTAQAVKQVRIITGSANGWGNATVFNIQYSDTSLTTGFTTAATITIPSGIGQVAVQGGIASGAHRYWRIIYASGTASGNAWLGELTFYA